MSATDTQDTSTGGGHGHPTPRDYVRIAAILGLLTAMEVSTYFLDFGAFGIPMLIVLMIVKFLLVVGWFMHLKFDSKHYTRLMYGGLLLAVVLYATALLLFQIGHFPTL